MEYAHLKNLKGRLSRWSVFESQGDGDKIRGGEHHWKAVVDFDAEEIDKKDDLPFNKDKDPYCIIAVGTTGAGKSSVVRLFCGDQVEVSADTTSCTKDSTIFEEINSNQKNRSWMDTQGTDDSEMTDTDEKILKKIFKKLYEKKIHNVMILWMVSGDMDRQKGEYLKQASFISGFQTSKSTTNIWESVLVIQKMGQLHPKFSQMRGVIDAAKHFGAEGYYRNDDSTIQKHLLGFKCVDYIKKADDDTYNTLLEAETPKEKLQGLGYVTGKEMKDIILQAISKMVCFHLEFEDKVCRKCSLRGDPRYIYSKCHWEPIPKHPKPLVDYHDGNLEFYHPLQTHIIHSGAIITLHTDVLELFHPIVAQPITVTDPDQPIFKHKGVYEAKSSGSLCCVSTIHKWSCCNASDENAQGCEKTFGTKKVMEFACCGARQDEKSEESKGCMKRYKCCLKSEETAEPCTSKYNCCDQPPNSIGCKTVYLCCSKEENAQGCQERHTCCQMPNGARGCKDKFECCNKDKDNKGCITVCSHCDIPWGHKPGCSWPQIEKEENNNDDDEI